MTGNSTNRNKDDMRERGEEQNYKKSMERCHALQTDVCVNGDSNPDLEHGKLEFYP